MVFKKKLSLILNFHEHANNLKKKKIGKCFMYMSAHKKRNQIKSVENLSILKCVTYFSRIFIFIQVFYSSFVCRKLNKN